MTTNATTITTRRGQDGRTYRITGDNRMVLKRHGAPVELPAGTLVQDNTGARFLRDADGAYHLVLSDGDLGATNYSALNLAYPIRVLGDPVKGLNLDRTARRRVDRQAKTVRARMLRSKVEGGTTAAALTPRALKARKAEKGGAK